MCAILICMPVYFKQFHLKKSHWEVVYSRPLHTEMADLLESNKTGASVFLHSPQIYACPLHTETADSSESTIKQGPVFFTLAPDFLLASSTRNRLICIRVLLRAWIATLASSTPNGAGFYSRLRLLLKQAGVLIHPIFYACPSTRRRPILSSDCWRGRVPYSSAPAQSKKQVLSW